MKTFIGAHQVKILVSGLFKSFYAGQFVRNVLEAGDGVSSGGVYT